MKKAIAALVLALTLTLGASFAMANTPTESGIIIFGNSDAPSDSEVCAGRTGIIIFGNREINCDEANGNSNSTGIIIFGATGIIIFGSTGIIIFG